MKVSLSVAVCCFGLALLGCASKSVTLQSPTSQGLFVTGEGEATAPPDLAMVRLGVEERALSAQQALTSANETMRRVTDAVKAQGVEAKDLQTTDLAMHFERQAEGAPVVMMPRSVASSGSASGVEDAGRANESSQKAPIPSGYYVVRNTVVISLRDLNKVGATIGAAMSAGANTLYGFEFSIEDPSKIENEAREKAIADAIEKAKMIANRAGVRLGSVIAIRDTQATPPMPFAGARMALQKAEASVPVERGQLSVRQSVEVTFSLGE